MQYHRHTSSLSSLRGAACFLILAAAILTSTAARAQIAQVDIGSFTTTPNQVQDVPAFTVSPGANVLVVNLAWRTSTTQSFAIPPAVTYNGVPLNIAALAIDNTLNHSDSAVLYLFNPTTGSNDLNVNFGGAIVAGALSAFDAFTLSGVDVNQAPEAVTGHAATSVNDGADVLSLPFSNLKFGAWADVAANYRQGANGTTQVLNAAITSGAGTPVTNGSGGSPANGNLYDQIVDTQMITAGALVSNISSAGLTVQETGPGSANHRFTMAGAVFVASHGASTWTGGSATTNNWTDGANWGGTPPAALNDLTFAGVNRTSPFNDTPANTNYSSITFDNTAGSFILSGNAIGIVGDIVNNSSSTQNINLNNMAVGFDININAASGNIAIGGSLSGSKSITLTGPNTVTLSGASSHSGATNVNNGTLVLNNANSLQSSTLVPGAGAVQFSSGIHNFNLGGLSGAANLAMTDTGATPVNLAVGGNGSNTTYSGNLSGGGILTKSGTGTMVLTGNNTINAATATGGQLAITGGTLRVAAGPFRYYEFQVTSLFNNAAANSIQISELQYFDSTNTRIPAVTATNPGGNNPAAETPPNANDNNLGTKWLDFNKGGPFLGTPTDQGLLYDFGSPKTLTQYNLATANDANERDPTGWKILASNDGVNFFVLDTRTGVTPPGGGSGGRQTWYDGNGSGNVQTSTFALNGTANTPIPANSAVVMSSNTTFDIVSSILTIGSLADAAGNPTGSQVLLGSGTLTVGNDNTTTKFSGAISGTGGNLTKVGNGVFTLAGISTYSGTTNVAAGTLRLASGSGLGNTAIFVGPSAKLAPQPAIGSPITAGATASLTLNSGSTYDMSDSKAGTFSLGGALALNNNVTLNFDIGTNGAATVTDSLASLGAATGSGTATINISGFGTANLTNGKYTLISAGSGLLAETFTLGTPTVLVNGTTYTLTLIPSATAEQLRVAGPSTTGNWTQMNSGTFSWGDIANWGSGAGPIPGGAGDTANFGAATANNETINLDHARSLGVLNFNNTLGGNYTIAGNGFSLTLDGGGAGAIVTNSKGANEISAPITLSDGTILTAAAGTSLKLSGVVSSNGPQAVIIGSGGAGTVALTNSNTFTGGLSITSGSLQVPSVNNASSSGPLGNQTSVTLGASASTGTLEYAGAASIASNMPLVMGSGGVGLVGVDTAGTTLTLSGNITGNGSFGTSGPGVVALTGSGNNFSGGLSLNNGTLRDSNPGAGTIGSGTVTFGTSNTPTLDLNGNSPTTGLLSSTGTNGVVTNGAAATSTLTLSGAGSASYGGAINKAAGDIALVVTGGGTQTLTGTSTFTGGITVPNGTLRIGNGASLAPTNALTLGGGTTSGLLALGDSNGAGNLTVTSLAFSGSGTGNAVVGGSAAGGTLRLNNSSPAVYGNQILGGTGTNQNNVGFTAGGPSSVTLTGNNSHNGGTTVTGGASLVIGPTTKAVTPLGSGPVILSGGTLALQGQNFGPGYRYYAFQVTALNSTTAPNSVQLSEVQYFDASNNWIQALATSDPHNDGNPPNENSPKANDANLATKWLDFNVGGGVTGIGPLIYDFGDHKVLGSYALATANDAVERDPTAWTISGSNDGVNFTVLDTQSGIADPAARQTWYNGGGTGIHPTAGTAYALVFTPPPAGFDATQTYSNALKVTANSTLNITGSLTVSMGTASFGAATLNVTSSDGTNSPYSLTLKNTTLTGNATINIANSTGNGPGTVTLGSVNDGAGGPFSLTKGGPGTLILTSKGNYGGGTTINGGTVRASAPGAIGTGTVTFHNGTALQAVAGPTAAPLINGFNGGADWTVTDGGTGVNGPAFSGNTLTLTNGQGDEARAAFFNTPQPIGAHGFIASYRYQDVGGGGADGAAFVMQNDPRGVAAIGNSGGGLGYGADAAAPLITPSVAHEINVYNGHVVGTNFVNGTTNPGTNNFLSTSPVNVASGNPIDVTISYDPTGGGTVTETDIDSVTQALYVHVYTVGDLTDPSTGVGGTTAYVGFTGGTGGATATQTITNFAYGTTGASSAYGNNLVVAPAASAAIDITPSANISSVTMGTLTVGANGTLNKVNTGRLETVGPTNLGNGASIHVNAGSLKLTNTTGNSTVGTSVTATVTAGATLELAGSVSSLSSPAAAADRVHVVNDSKQTDGGSLLVSGTNQQVGGIDGIGDTVVAAGASLTADHIIQNALVIGGTSGSPSFVTIAASDASGNPTADSAVAGFASLGTGAPIAVAGSSLLTGIPSSGSLGAPLGSVNLGGGSAAVPEPSTMLLLMASALGLVPALRRVRRGRR